MEKKINNLKDMQYYADMELLGSLLKKWNKKTKHKEVQAMTEAYIRLVFYVKELQEWKRLSEKSFSEYRADKLRAIERARASDDRLEKCKDEYKQLRKITGI